jgi:serine phosphatase RsbU (regulator of sigma subunit)
VLQHKEIRVSKGDRFFLYTDGLIECSVGGRRRDGIGRLVHACVDHRAESLAEAVSKIAGEIQSSAASVNDDLLLLGIDVTR